MVLDGRGLTDAQMQAFAKETNLSETTFILPRTTIECERGVRVRVFTIEEELPFAGHPTLGTAFVLRGASGAREIKLDLNVGPVPVRFKDTSGQPAFGEMTQVEIPSSGLSTIAQPHARMLFYNGEDPAIQGDIQQSNHGRTPETCRRLDSPGSGIPRETLIKLSAFHNRSS